MSDSQATLATILVVDLEATCWDGEPPDGEHPELIEVGWCLLDAVSGVIGEPQALLVLPTGSHVSAFCTRLTTLTAEQVARGLPFRDACERLRQEWRSREWAWASFGTYDRVLIQRQCSRENVTNPFRDEHIDIRRRFASVTGRRELGLSDALRVCGLEPAGSPHRAASDAYNAARLLRLLLDTPAPETIRV